MTNELTEFLLARVAEERAAALESFANYGPGEPERVLAECEAKWRIIKEIWSWGHTVVDDCWYTCPMATEEREGETCCNENAGDECNCGADWRRDRILRSLALPYTNHPDFREEWNL